MIQESCVNGCRRIKDNNKPLNQTDMNSCFCLLLKYFSLLFKEEIKPFNREKLPRGKT